MSADPDGGPSSPDRGRLAAAVAFLERFTERIGEAVAWLCLATVLLCFASVYLRYVLGIGLVWLQESYVWTHAAAVMLGSAYSLMKGGFVRVDMLFSRMSERGKAWVDLLGSLLFLAPFAAMLAHSGWGFFAMSWRMGERSGFEGGLPATYVLKGTLLLFVLLIAVQASAMALRSILRITAPRDTANAAGARDPAGVTP